MAQKVFVGLSGGVDSAVSAALLQQQGFDVTGVFIKIWQPEFIECTWKEDRLDALRVCAALGIPFRELDLSDEYKRTVVEEMVADYARGVTPNPDVLCNRSIKFGSFAQWAFEQGADIIATGHYARIAHTGNQFQLLRGIDAAKDQSYFLYRLNQKDLARSMFPVGGYHKTDIRRMAKEFGLPVAQKPDSQGLCFVGDVSMHDFLERYISLQSGSVVDGAGTVIGTHDGVALYTIGQRHGFTTNDAGPYYVVKIDAQTNTLHVSRERMDATRVSATISDVSWVHAAPTFPARVRVQARYHETPVGASLAKSGGEIVATFDAPHIASPGQSLVFYKDDECIGGGVIQ
jgi:tRNA-specific 2-thiouridylase